MAGTAGCAAALTMRPRPAPSAIRMPNSLNRHDYRVVTTLKSPTTASISADIAPSRATATSQTAHGPSPRLPARLRLCRRLRVDVDRRRVRLPRIEGVIAKWVATRPQDHIQVNRSAWAVPADRRRRRLMETDIGCVADDTDYFEPAVTAGRRQCPEWVGGLT